MSWLFGLQKPDMAAIDPNVAAGVQGAQQDGAAGVGAGIGGGIGGSGGNDNTGYRSDAYSFDSTALERAAKAAKVFVFYN